MASGSAAAFEKARPVLDAIAETVFELGDSAGPGSAMKAVNQLLAGGSGLGGEDDAAVAKIYARNAGIDLP